MKELRKEKPHRAHLKNEGLQLLQALMDRQCLNRAQADSILAGMKNDLNPHAIEKKLFNSRIVEENIILETKAALLGVPYVSLENQIVDVNVLNLIPVEIANQFLIFPLFNIHEKLFIAMADPNNVNVIDHISQLTGLKLSPTLASPNEIKQMISKYYETSQNDSARETESDMQEILEIIEADRPEDGIEISVHELEKMTQEAPVVRMTNMILNMAIKEGASDVHICPEENQLSIKMRIDGILRNSFILPKYLKDAVISRIKVLARLDISEHRLPQDGQIQLRIKDGRKLDIRVSTFPINYGEDVVLRILNNDPSLINLNNLGIEDNVLRTFFELIGKAYGIFLVTGPTGSGKTTTLYASMNHLNNGEKNMMTLEDPIEYNFSFIRQSQVNEKGGMSFAQGLRSVLRHDPDIILVGEIRDQETARIAVQAALTGHLVLSTLHTNDAASAILRMFDLGIDPFLFSSALLGVAGQRLVRKICPHCREVYQPMIRIPEDFLRDTIPEKDQKDIRYFRGKGCKACRGTGYSGRIAIMEVLPVTQKIRELILRTDSDVLIKKEAVAEGMRTLLEDGYIKVLKGITTLEEVMRVTNISV